MTIQSSKPTTRRRTKIIAAAAALWLSLSAGMAGARINLKNVGVNTDIKLGTFDPTEPPPTGGGGGPGTVRELQNLGYTCEPGHLADIECRACSLESVSDTNTCALYLCRLDGACNNHRFRWDLPRDMPTSELRMWAVEFAFGASSYFLADFNGDGKRDLGARVGSTVRVALSRGTYFEPQAAPFTGPFTVENAGPPASVDINRDGRLDVLSINPDGFLTAGISNGSAVISTLTIPQTWCEMLGDCLIGDVDGDGLADVVEIMRGAVAGHRTGDVWVSHGHEAPGFPPLPAAPAVRDTDGDGIVDRDDNCTLVANETQRDSDNDGFGNACDPDLNNDGVVTAADLTIFNDCFGANVKRRTVCAPSDFDDSGKVNTADSAVINDALDKVPGPSAAHSAPRIELAAPADGTILPVGSTKAWVAGYVPDVPASGLKVTVDGVQVPVTGPSNLFSTFVDVPIPSATKMFRSIVIEVTRGGLRTVERRAVVIGDRTLQGRRSELAFGARLTTSGLDRLEQFVRETVVPKIVADMPGKINGYRHDSDCAILGLGGPLTCWDGYEVTHATLATPTIAVDFDGTTLHMNIVLPRLDFDWNVDSQAIDCGEHATATNLTVDLRYGVGVANGRVEVTELQEPAVTGNFNISGCWGAGHGRVKDGIINGLAGALNDPDDYQGHHEPFQKSPVGAAIEKIFGNLAQTGNVKIRDAQSLVEQAVLTPERRSKKVASPLLQPALFVSFDTRFDYASLDATGMTAWLDAGIEPTAPVPGLGTPSGAYQIPASYTAPVRTTPPGFPNAQPNGAAYNLSAAITPNGLNEMLEALTRSGLLQQTKTVTSITVGTSSIPLDAGLLTLAGIPAFSVYPANEPITARISLPSFAPIVSGKRGPNNEPVDVHVAQVRIELVDSHQRVAVGLRADFRVGVTIGLGTSESGSLVATAQGLQLLDFTLMTNPINANPADVFRRILCVDRPANDTIPCALGGALESGLGLLLKTIDLPSLADEDPATPDVTLAPQCLQVQPNGVLFATFGIRLPSDPPPTKLSTLAVNTVCMAPFAVVDTGTPSRGAGTMGTLTAR